MAPYSIGRGYHSLMLHMESIRGDDGSLYIGRVWSTHGPNFLGLDVLSILSVRLTQTLGIRVSVELICGTYVWIEQAGGGVAMIQSQRAE